VPPLAAFDLSEAGWHLREGQVLWRNQGTAPPIAGELLLATNPDGRTWVQFSKTPLPFFTARTTATNWQIEFAFQKRSFRGSGLPPARLLWLHLARALNGAVPRRPLRFDPFKDGGACLENTASGESVTVYLAP